MPALPVLALSLCVLLSGCSLGGEQVSYTLDQVPAYAGESSVILNGNVPAFTEAERADATAFESYSELDYLGRPGAAYACVGPETLPTEERGAIGMVKPAGWHTVKYDFVDGKYLYNRCHLIGFQLTGENANEKNLFTGTRSCNVDGMLPYENAVREHVDATGGHVLYRATPIYDGLDLLCSGVELEGWSVEDGGEGVCFDVYVYNVQPGVVIDYATGESWAEGEAAPAPTATPEPGGTVTYVLNENSRRFHLPTCSGAANISASNRRDTDEDRQALIDQGYVPCGTCKP